MKKIIYCFAFILLLTGCSATYDIEVTTNNINQNITVFMNSTEVGNSTVIDVISNKLLEVEKDSEILGYFTIEGINTSNPLKASRIYPVSTYNWDTSLARCYDNQTITFQNNILVLTTSNNFNCFSKYSILKTVTINLKSDYEVLSNNADSVENGIYTWNITKDNALNKPINLSIDFSNNIESRTSSLISIIIIVSITLAITGFIIFSFLKNKKNNSL